MKTIKLILVCSIILLSQSLFAQRVLTQSEKETLVHSEAFRVKCAWAISDYAKYWYSHDGNSLSDVDRKTWRERYPIYKAVVKAEWVDNNLTQRFVNLSKEYSLNFGSNPTPDDLVAVLESNNKFEQLAGLYFNLISE